MNRQVLLLAIVGALLFIRFVIVPLNDNRLEKIDVFEAKHARFIKGENLLQQKEIIQSKVKDVNARLGQYETLYPRAPSSFEAQLTVQQQLQNLAKDKRIILDEVEWVSTIEGNPEKALLEISFNGDLKDLMYFFTAVEQLGPWVSVVDIQYRVDKQKIKRKQLGVAKGKMLLDVFYLIKDVS